MDQKDSMPLVWMASPFSRRTYSSALWLMVEWSARIPI